MSCNDDGVGGVVVKRPPCSWLDRLPEDVCRYLHTQYNVFRRENGDWICVGPLEHLLREKRIRRFPSCLSAMFCRRLYHLTLQIESRPSTTIVNFIKCYSLRLNKYLRTHTDVVIDENTCSLTLTVEPNCLSRTPTEFTLTRSFVQGLDIRGNLSLQPVYQCFRDDHMILLP